MDNELYSLGSWTYEHTFINEIYSLYSEYTYWTSEFNKLINLPLL